MQFANSKSFYGQEFLVRQKKYEGPQYDTIACILPGQGLLKPGFLKTDLKKLHSVQFFLNRADQWLKTKYPDYKFTVTDYSNRPENISEDHVQAVQNIFLLSISCGFFELLKQKGYEKFVITSHSFGEYASFVCAGAITFEAMLEIVWMREICSPKPNTKGGLIALNIKLSEFEMLQSQNSDLQKAELANINSNQQLVIAVANSDLTLLTKVLKKLKIAHKKLSNVTQPYHSSLMKESANQFRVWLQNFEFTSEPLKYAVLSSVNQKIYPLSAIITRAELIELFERQLTCKVNFVEQINKLKIECGIFSYIQLIEGDTYLNFIQNSLNMSELSQLQLSSVEFFYKTNAKSDQISRLDLEKLKTSRIFKRLTEHIESVTGFSVLEIEIMDQFQADLRIDSIKKAEIVFKTLEDFNIHIEESLSLAQFKTIAEVVHYLDGIKHHKKSNQKKNLLDEKNSYMGVFKLFETNETLEHFPVYAAEGFKKLSTYFHTITDLDIENLPKISAKQTDILILEVTGLETYFNAHEFTQDAFLKLFSYFKFLLEEIINIHQQNSSLRIIFLSRKNYAHIQALSAFTKSFCKEYHIPFKTIQLSPDISHSEVEKLVLDEANDNYTTDVVYKNDTRFVKNWVPLTKIERLPAQEIKNIVIIGGAKGFAGAQLSHFKKSTHKICVIGRTPSDSPEIVKFIKKNKNRFSVLQYKECDASKAEEIEATLIEIKEQFGHIDLVINAAGQEKSEELLGKSIESAASEFSSKYSITQNLMRFKKKINFRILNYSSIVGYFGNEGQTVYSFANGYQLDLDVLNILWPAIDKVGMTTNKGLYEKMRATGLHFAKLQSTVDLIENIIENYDGYKQKTNNLLYTHPQDIFLFESKSLDLRRLRTLAGQIVNLDDVSFSKEFHLLRDGFLNDHTIENTAVIPASYIVSLFLNIARYYNKQIKLDQFSIKNILLFTQTQLSCDLNLSPKFTKINNENHLLGFNCSVSTQVDNYAAHMSLPINTEIKHYRVSTRYDQSVFMNTIYSKECVNFGHKFQLIKNILFNKNNDRYDLIGVSPEQLFYYSGDARFDAVMFLVEAAFQMACVNGLLTNKGLGIPSQFESLKIHKLDFEKLYIVPELLDVTTPNNTFLCHVVVYNEKNECIAELNKLEMTAIKSFEQLPIKFEEAAIVI